MAERTLNMESAGRPLHLSSDNVGEVSNLCSLFCKVRPMTMGSLMDCSGDEIRKVHY